MKKFLKILLAIVGVMLLIALLQVFGIIPMRCDDLGPGYISNSDGTTTLINPSGKHCYSVLLPGFWIKPNYL